MARLLAGGAAKVHLHARVVGVRHNHAAPPAAQGSREGKGSSGCKGSSDGGVSSDESIQGVSSSNESLGGGSSSHASLGGGGSSSHGSLGSWPEVSQGKPEVVTVDLNGVETAEQFDHVVVATQAHHALKLLRAPPPALAHALGTFK